LYPRKSGANIFTRRGINWRTAGKEKQQNKTALARMVDNDSSRVQTVSLKKEQSDYTGCVEVISFQEEY
jgi:hypothetical protein